MIWIGFFWIFFCIFKRIWGSENYLNDKKGLRSTVSFDFEVASPKGFPRCNRRRPDQAWDRKSNPKGRKLQVPLMTSIEKCGKHVNKVFVRTWHEDNRLMLNLRQWTKVRRRWCLLTCCVSASNLFDGKEGVKLTTEGKWMNMEYVRTIDWSGRKQATRDGISMASTQITWNSQWRLLLTLHYWRTS